MLVDRDIARFYDYLHRMDEYGAEWSDAALVHDAWSYLTPAELEAVGQQLMAVVRPYLERLRDPEKRPPDSRPVMFFLAGFPTEPEGVPERRENDA